MQKSELKDFKAAKRVSLPSLFKKHERFLDMQYVYSEFREQ